MLENKPPRYRCQHHKDPRAVGDAYAHKRPAASEADVLPVLKGMVQSVFSGTDTPP